MDVNPFKLTIVKSISDEIDKTYDLNETWGILFYMKATVFEEQRIPQFEFSNNTLGIDIS